MFKTSDRASFLIIFFGFSSTMSLKCSTVMFVAVFHRHFYCDSFTREENCIPNLPCTQRPFGNYWASAMFRGRDFIAKLSDGLKIIYPIFITCDDIGKLLFVTSLKHLKHLFGHFIPLSVLFISQQMWYPSSKNLSDFQMLPQNKVNH